MTEQLSHWLATFPLPTTEGEWVRVLPGYGVVRTCDTWCLCDADCVPGLPLDGFWTTEGEVREGLRRLLESEASHA